MSAQIQPSLRKVISDTSRIISSNSLHFATLSLLLIFPIPLFNIIHTLLQHPSPSPFNSSQYGQLPSFNKSQLLYFLFFLIFNLFSISSLTHSIFHAFHKNPIKVSSSLKSILSSFLPLLFRNHCGYFHCLRNLHGSHSHELDGSRFRDRAHQQTSHRRRCRDGDPAPGAARLLGSAVVADGPDRRRRVQMRSVQEERWPREGGEARGILRSLGVRHYAGGFGGCAGGISGGVVVRLVVYAALSTVVLLFGVAAKTVLFVHCREFNGELELQSDVNKLGQVYVQLPPLDVVDEV
ncbi:hypothetical protein SASPL_107805 [Salvia splendens]|uniref:Transmembrane protein n=1 Tax=Salvia splendens TaxID=180675 RepID=A0A8X9A4S5_SALSN|nr:hypothetical protein SASPL_107805 [Salvia splendens]